MDALLQVADLSVQFNKKSDPVTAVSNLSFAIKPKETVCLVGESGSGKTVTAKALMRLIDYENGSISQGKIRFATNDLAGLPQKDMQSIRGKDIAMVFQEPMAAFDPLFTIGSQMIEFIRQHKPISKQEAKVKAVSLLERVGISDPAFRMNQYPNELSGGMLQRAMIAMALSCDPKLLIADEPTTALDVTIQAQIIDLLNELKEAYDMSLLLVTHDMGVAANIADRMIVMYAGKIVEEGDVREIFKKPHHPYTRGLLQSITRLDREKDDELYAIPGSIPNLTEMPSGCPFHPRCEFATTKCRTTETFLKKVNGRLSACLLAENLVDRPDWDTPSISRYIGKSDDRLISPESNKRPLLEVKNVKKYYPLKNGFKNRQLKAVDDVSFTIYEGETFGLIGESGSGKSTLGRVILQLEKATSGTVKFKDQDLQEMAQSKFRQKRQDMQMIFQDPFGSINPRWKIKDIIAEPLIVHRQVGRKQVIERVKTLMRLVGLKQEWLNRYPHEFSGGQRQRIGIARAIALNPSFIVADEPVSALDVSVQAQIINLLKNLQQTQHLTYLFIGHGLSTVRYISDRVGVMYLGNVVEIAPAEELFSHPLHPYTQALIASHLIPDPAAGRRKPGISGEIPSPANPPSGCRFRTRCPFATDLCGRREPEFREFSPGHYISCHYPLTKSEG